MCECVCSVLQRGFQAMSSRLKRPAAGSSSGAKKRPATASQKKTSNVLFEKLVDALNARGEKEGTETALKFVLDPTNGVQKVLGGFAADGHFLGGEPWPASCYNDFYKWTMLPAIMAVEQARGDIRCTFSVNIRDKGYRKQLYESATGKAPPDLFEEVKKGLSSLTSRPFDREVFERCAEENALPNWGKATIDAVCGTKAAPRMLVQEFRDDPSCRTPLQPSCSGNVLVQVFVAQDEKLKEDRVYVEATGPWHRVTWLETSMMQVVYDALLRDRKRQEYGITRNPGEAWDDSSWYPKWLAEAFSRCTMSVAAAAKSGLTGALFTGRRTGGLALMAMQGLYVQHAFRKEDGSSMCLGTSSVTSHYMCLDAGIEPAKVPKCAGTHAHELSMVIGAVMGELDDEVGMPLSQLVGHMLYFYRSCPKGDVREARRKVLMPMLPDTLGSRAFMKVGSILKVPFGAHKGEPLLSVIGAARQDSGGLDDFRKLMDEFGYTGALMASEIEVADDLFTAEKCGFKCFGAGGYMGDSEKAWDKSKSNISMAVKVLRVYVNGERCRYTPVKTGETSNEGMIKEGKFEADGILSPEELLAVKDRAQVLATAEQKVDTARIQQLLDSTLAEILGPM